MNIVEQRLRHSPSYERYRWVFRQFVRHFESYPPPVLETLVYQPFSRVEKQLYYNGSLSTDRLVLPDFLGIGAMKSGTTWLWGQLRLHPQINMTAKEIHYFCWHFHRSMRFYSRFFEPTASPGKLNGEITVEYAYLPMDRIRFIHRLMPDLKLLYIIRNPIERAWSHAKQELMFRTERSFEQVRESEWIGRFTGEDSRRLGSYSKTIDRWSEVFGKDRLWVGFYDDIKDRPQELLSEVFTFLGIDPHVEWVDFPVEERFMGGVAAPPLPGHLRAVLEEIYADEIEELYRRYGEKVASWRVR